MKIAKHVDFESLLSNTASAEAIVGALKVADEPDSHKDTKIEKIAESKGDKAIADTAQAGALGAGVMAYGAHSTAKKKVKKLGKQYKKAKKAEDYANRPLKQRVSDFFAKLNKKPKPTKPLSQKILKKMNKIDARGKKGAALALGAAGVSAAIGAYKSHSDSQGKLAKTASDEEVRGQIANDVERDSTPEGGAKHRGTQGAIVGGLAGFIHGATKKSPIKGKRSRLLRGAWHGTAGAVWGGGAMGAATYAKKKLVPDTAEDKQREFERRLEKRASVAYIGELDLASAFSAVDKTASLMSMFAGFGKSAPSTGARIMKSPQARKMEALKKKKTVKKINYGEAYSMKNNAALKNKMQGIQSRWS
jgi:hypothetical protein